MSRTATRERFCDSAGHERGLREARRAVVHARVGNLHAEELRGERLELVGCLERPLGNLRLVGRVGGEELAAGDQWADDGGAEMVIDARAEETGVVACVEVALSQRSHRSAEVHFRHGVRQIERRVAELLGDVGEEILDGGHADLGQHGLTVSIGVGDEW